MERSFVGSMLWSFATMVFTYFVVPETSGKTPLEVQASLQKADAQTPELWDANAPDETVHVFEMEGTSQTRIDF